MFWWRETLEWTVEEIGRERERVDVHRKLIEIFAKKIQAKLAEIWGERT